MNIDTAQLDMQLRKMVEGIRHKIATGVMTSLRTEEVHDYVKKVISEISKLKEEE